MSRKQLPPSEVEGAVLTRLGKRGTVVIPARLRREAGMDEGALIMVEVRDGAVLMRQAPIDDFTPQERQRIIDDAIRGYEALRGNPDLAAQDRAERSAWQSIAGETLPPEVWTDDDFVGVEE